MHARGAAALMALAAAARRGAAQHPGDGIAKFTMACSDPHAALDWAIENLPVRDCRTADGSDCNATWACAKVGRSNLCADDACSGSNPMGSFMFPHLVNLTARPFGAVSVDDVERAYQRKLAAGFAARAYDAWMDMSLVLYARNLTRYASRFAAGGTPFLPLAWPDETGKEWYSLIFTIPRTQVVVELVSDSAAAGVRGVADGARLNAAAVCAAVGCAAATPGVLLPMAVSKAVSSLANVSAFYRDVFRGTAVWNATGGGARATSFAFAGAAMQVRVVERPGGNTSGAFTVAELEAAKFDGHRRALGRTQEESALCGFSKWYDNHWGMDQHAVTLGSMIDAMEARAWPYYHMWSWNMYIVDPTGDSVQMDADWGDAPSWYTLAEDDALQNGCTQGNCGVVEAPAGCNATLARVCPGVALALPNECADCVHWHWDELRTAGCYNADAVRYCVGLAPSSGWCYVKYADEGTAAKAGVTAVLPRAGGGGCDYVADTDVAAGSGTYAGALSARQCCSICGADPACAAAVYQPPS